MDIQHEIKTFLERSGWNTARLAREAGLAFPIVSRLKSGERKNLTMRTYKKLEPFLCGDQPNQQANEE